MIFDIYIWKEDCDRYGTEYCENQIGEIDRWEKSDYEKDTHIIYERV